MSFGDLTRINTNLQALRSYNSLQTVNSDLAMRQRRLATGKRINRAEDDSAGYSIAKKLESRVRGQAQALANIGDAKSVLTVAEGGLSSTMDILQTLKEKAIQANNDSLGDDERTAIQNQLDELAAEIDDISSNTEFNGNVLLDGSFAGGSTGESLTFQVGADGGDTFSFNIDNLSAASLGTGTMAVDALDVTTSGTTREQTLNSIDEAISQVSEQLGDLGDKQNRLSFKQDNLATSKNNYDAARSRIEDADFAKEQMQITKLQILQQTGTAALTQANASAQSVLQLL